MPIEAIGAAPLAPQRTVGGQGPALPVPGTDGEASVTFGQFLGEALRSVSAAQSNAGATVERFAAGEQIDIHRLIIELEKASTAMALTVQVRNRLMEAYQEIMRTAV
ncbi:MAG TPA: flagellar hook-basal body complex protein FliE [Chthonomonadales bacterium]|nr:flagellar hook-basal body complex protein FliE [Chthonomonadales bacterium]